LDDVHPSVARQPTSERQTGDLIYAFGAKSGE